MAPLRSGIIGAGFMGRVHAHAVRVAGGRVTVVAASTPASADAAREVLHADRAATADEVVVADDVDIVHVCTPNHLHRDLVEQALQAGKHVVCEKPLAPTLDDARAMADLASAVGTVTAVPFVYRSYAMVRQARSLVASGDLGDLHLLHGTYLQDWLADEAADNWRTSASLGGPSRVFGDIGVHWCDLVEFVTGHRITRLAARTVAVHPERGGRPVDTEDAATVTFETDAGALGSVVLSQVTRGRKNRLWFSFDGTDGSVSFDQEHPETLWVGRADHVQVVPRNATGAATSPLDLPPGHPQGYQDAFNRFVADVHAAIRGPRPDGLADLRDGLRAAAITSAVVESARTQQWVDVPA